MQKNEQAQILGKAIMTRLGVLKYFEKDQYQQMNLIRVAEEIATFLDVESRYNSDSKTIFLKLIVNGNYPNFDEFKYIKSKMQVFGTFECASWLIRLTLQNQSMLKNSILIKLENPKSKHLMDVTHTRYFPVTTGIQRVVKEISNLAKLRNDIDFIEWRTDLGIATKIDKSEIFIGQISSIISEIELRENPTFKDRLHRKLHKLLNLNFVKLLIKLAPISFRRIAKNLLKRILFSQSALHVHKEDSFEYTNIVLLNRTITVPELGLEHGPIIYPIFEDADIDLQFIVYDFIPIFHSRYLGSSHLTFPFSEYLHYLLRGKRLIAISKVVAEQAHHMTQVVKAEYPEYTIPKIEYLNLPPGLRKTSPKRTSNSNESEEDSPYFLMVGTIDPRKNHELFIDALTILHLRGIRVKGFIAGFKGTAFTKIENLVKERSSLGVDIEFLDYVSEETLQALIEKATAVCMLSRAEGFGLPLVEALQNGTQVIATKIRPFLDFNFNGITYVNRDDSRELAEQMLYKLQKENLKDKTSHSMSYDTQTWQDWVDLLFK